MQYLFDIPLQDVLLFILIFALLGSFAGFLAGLLGVGGGIILVPGLYYSLVSLQEKLNFETSGLMHMAVGTSLAIIVPTGLASARAHYKRGAVDLNPVTQLGIGVVIGVVAATWIASDLSGQQLKMFFALVIAVLACIMMLDPARFQVSKALPRQPLTGLAGVVIGGVSTLVGIGGATLSVPYMSLNGIAMRTAVGSAATLGLVISIPASLGFILIGWGVDGLPPLSLGYVNILAWVFIVPLSVLVAPLGAHVAHVVSVRSLRKIFALFMVIVALNMWRQVLFAPGG
jgi:uncharacterized membrane protein YfcA